MVHSLKLVDKKSDREGREVVAKSSEVEVVVIIVITVPAVISLVDATVCHRLQITLRHAVMPRSRGLLKNVTIVTYPR